MWPGWKRGGQEASVVNPRRRCSALAKGLYSGIAGTAGAALATAAVVALTPLVSAGPLLLANPAVYFLQGTKIGDTWCHPAPNVFTTEMMAGVRAAAPEPADFHFVDYPATIGPFSHGGFGDPSWGESVGRGIAALGEQPQRGDTVFGFSQGAVVATAYKRDHLGNGVDYVLVENPGRPNGGIFERFRGLSIPLLNVRFSGATPVVDDPADTGGVTTDIARQYDGWADFPAYPLNLLATANAVLGMVYLHGSTQDIDQRALAAIDRSDARYYQRHGDTTYYLIPTKRLPLLMPLQGLLPKPMLDKVDAPLRALIERGYDRSDYSKPAPAQMLPPTAKTSTRESAPGTIANSTAGTSTDDPPGDAPPKPARPSSSATPRPATGARPSATGSQTSTTDTAGETESTPSAPKEPAPAPAKHESKDADSGAAKPDAA